MPKPNARPVLPIPERIPAPGLSGVAPRGLSQLFGLLQVDDSGLTVWEAGDTLLGGQQRQARTDEERRRAVMAKIGEMASALRLRSGAAYASVAAAMEWHQDSMAADNETVAFISACIGIEVLLGTDQQVDSMSDRLADRYAFAFGRTRDERRDLFEYFKELLQVRGRLVHGRQPRLQSSDREKLNEVRRILEGLIRRELGALVSA